MPASAGARRERFGRSPLPSGGDIIFMSVLGLLLALLPDFLFGDASTGWHLVGGMYTLDHLRVPQRDLISYTFPTQRWIPFEWLFDAAAAGLVRLGGLPLLAVAAASSIALLFLLLFQDVRRTGCHFLPALGLTLTGALASSVHWLARPHLFTFFGVYVFARVLEALHRGELRGPTPVIALALTMLVWSNAHPGFLIGFAMLAIYFASEAFNAVVLAPGADRDASLHRAKTLLAALPVVGGMTLVNPNGPELYPSFADALRQLGGATQTQEFQSPTFHGELYSTCLGLLFASLIVGLCISRRRPWGGRLLLVLAFAALTLNGARNVPLFVIVALPLIADLFADADLPALTGITGAALAGWTERWRRGWQRLGPGIDQTELRCTMHLIPIATVAVLAISCMAAARVPGVRPFVSSGFNAQTTPTSTLNYIKNHGLPWNRGFSLDNWGGYIRYKTGQRVFVDDRTTFYSRDFIRRYGETLSAWPGWQDFLAQYRIVWVLIPKTTPLASVLRQSRGWQLQAEDPAAYLFVRTGPQRPGPFTDP
jgi:hypothetical protein